ncbi:MAG: flagellar filament capping protein FliD [Sedimentisphaerales bacterium]
MGTITFPGLQTGIDTSAIITQLVTAESQNLTAYQTQKKAYDNQNTALASVRDKVTALKTTTSALADTSTLNIYNASSSNTDELTVSATTGANAGSHTVDINQLATTETWIQDNSTFNYPTDYVGDGTFIYSYNNQQRTITTVANETTLQDLVNLINKDSNNPGVTASLLNNGGKYHLMLSGQEAGEDYKVSIDSQYTELWKPDASKPYNTLTSNAADAGLTTKITELDQFTTNGGLKGGEKIIISGTNHFGTSLANKELNVTANTTVGQLIDAINTQFDGVAKASLVNGQIYLSDNISGTSGLGISFSPYDSGDKGGDTDLGLPTMAVSTEGGGTPSKLLNLGTFSQTQSAQSSEIKIDGYPSTATPEEQRLTLGSVAIETDPPPDPPDPPISHFHLTYNGQTTGEIAYNATTEQIQAALEALSNVNPGDIVVGGDSLDQHSIQYGYTSFKFLGPAGDTKMISIDTSALSFSNPNAKTATFAETTKGNNGYLQRNSNSISDVLSGVTLNLKDVTTTDSVDTPVQITITKNTSSVSQKIQALATAYNDLITALKSNTEYNATAKKMGILSDDLGVSLLNAQSRSPFVGIAKGFIDGTDSFVQASDIGLTIDGAGMMQFDTTKFSDAANKDFNGVLDLLGATKSSDSQSGVVQFYAASSKYTTAGTYNIQVDIDNHQITRVGIKKSTESTFRYNSTWLNNLVTGISTFDANGNPVYPENGLQLTVDLTQPQSTYTATISVKQGIVGALDDLIGKELASSGPLDVSKNTLDDESAAMQKKIDDEQTRLDTYKQTLVDKYARLEQTLTLIQQQMQAVNQLYSQVKSSS